MAASVRGTADGLPFELTNKPLDELTDRELEMLYQYGKKQDLKLYRFKNTHNDLPRVWKCWAFSRAFPLKACWM